LYRYCLLDAIVVPQETTVSAYSFGLPNRRDRKTVEIQGATTNELGFKYLPSLRREAVWWPYKIVAMVNSQKAL